MLSSQSWFSVTTPIKAFWPEVSFFASKYHLPFVNPKVAGIAVQEPGNTAFKLPSDKVIAEAGFTKGFNVAKLLVHVSVLWSVAARLTSVKSVPPFLSLPRLDESSKSK